MAMQGFLSGVENTMVHARPPWLQRPGDLAQSLAGIKKEHQAKPANRGVETGFPLSRLSPSATCVSTLP